MESRNYPGVKVDRARLSNELHNLFYKDGYDVRERQEPTGIVLEAANKISMLRVWTGFSHSLTVRITSEPGGTRVWVGKQRWIEKIVVGCVGLLLLLWSIGFILIILAALGAYRQYKITQDAWGVIEDHVALQSTANP